MEVILPLFGVALGWALNEASQLIRARSAAKKPIARALSNLLEMRFALLRVPKASQLLADRLQMPAVEFQAAQPLFASIMPPLDDVRARYSAAVEEIGEIDPLLGFELRHKEIVSELDRLVAPARELDPHDEQQWAVLKPLLLDRVEEPLNETILMLARRHGVLTWLRTQRRLKVPVTLPPEIEELLQQAVAALQPPPGQHPPQPA